MIFFMNSLNLGVREATSFKSFCS